MILKQPKHLFTIRYRDKGNRAFGDDSIHPKTIDSYRRIELDGRSCAHSSFIDVGGIARS